MDKNIKFKSRIGVAMAVALLIYHALIIGILIMSYFLYKKDLTNGIVLFLLAVDFAFLLPLSFCTSYTLEEESIYIHQWPFIRLRIRYCDIFLIDNKPDGEGIKPQSAAIAQPVILIGYYFYEENKKTNEKKKVKRYIEISPKDMDLFYIKMGGKFKRARDLAAKLEDEHKQQKAEHYKKKEIADKARKEKEEQNKPVDVVVKSVKKNEAKVKIEETDD